MLSAKIMTCARLVRQNSFTIILSQKLETQVWIQLKLCLWLMKLFFGSLLWFRRGKECQKPDRRKFQQIFQRNRRAQAKKFLKRNHLLKTQWNPTWILWRDSLRVVKDSKPFQKSLQENKSLNKWMWWIFVVLQSRSKASSRLGSA